MISQNSPAPTGSAEDKKDKPDVAEDKKDEPVDADGKGEAEDAFAEDAVDKVENTWQIYIAVHPAEPIGVRV